MTRIHICVPALAALLSAFSAFPQAGELLFQQDFGGVTSLEQAGWTLDDPGKAFLWTLGEGALKLRFRPMPYNGGKISHAVPSADNEELTLDLSVGVASANYRHFSLKFGFENTSFAFKNSYGGHMLQRYSPKDNRETTISGEVPLGQRTKIRIASRKTDKGRAFQYFIDDMDSPVFVEDGVEVAPSKDGKSQLTIGNYGLCLGEVSHYLYSISLRRLPEESRSATVELQKGMALLFLGMAYERYRIPELMKRLGVSQTRSYAITNKAPAETSRNTFRIDKLPPLETGRIPEYIFLVDFPLNAGMLPGVAVDELKRKVREGSTLVVLGGLCTLNKGEFQGGGLRDLIPLDMADPWAVKVLKDAEIFPGGHLRYLHRLLPDDVKDVVATVDGGPLWVARGYGKGRVVVFLGMPCGTSTQKMFWASEEWPRYAAGMIVRKNMK